MAQLSFSERGRADLLAKLKISTVFCAICYALVSFLGRFAVRTVCAWNLAPVTESL